MSKLRVWWIPQVGAISEAFYVPVQSVEEGKKVLDMLAAYDAFQLQNRIKPDYSNAGGLQIYNPEIADYEDWYLETDDDYFDDVDDYCEQCERAEELTEFNRTLFEQIDWEKIERMTRQEVDVMTIRDIRDCLFEVRNQDQEITIEDLCEIMGLWNRYNGIDKKIDELYDENISTEFIRGWQKEKAETLNMIRNYECKQISHSTGYQPRDSR